MQFTVHIAALQAHILLVGATMATAESMKAYGLYNDI